MIKYFRFNWHQVLWEISWVNLNMLLATIPVFKYNKKNKGKDDSDDEENEEDLDLSEESELATFLS